MRKIYFMGMAMLLFVTSCTTEDFEESYANPAKVSVSSTEKQFAGFLVTNHDYVIPSYWNYFVVMRTTVNRYTQAVGWVNSSGQYVPGGGLITNRWDNYYSFLLQYREFERIYSELPADDQEARRIFMIAATIYLYDHTQKVIDLHGDIPFFEAGKLSVNGGDYLKSLPAYDNAGEIYTKMLDDLKAFADELNSIDVPAGVLTGFKTQDFVNDGNLELWKRYCNSLRVRILSRVSGVSAFQSRVDSELNSIFSNPATYPVVDDNSNNIQIEVYNLSTNLPINLNSTGFRSGLEDWNGNIAGKAMIDQMVNTSDPRLRVMFEPGVNAAGTYKGIDPLMASSAQQALIDGGTISIYNRSTLSRNQYFPGVLINAAEVYLLKAEYYLNEGNDAAAKTAYNEGIKQSIKEYYLFRSVTNDNVSGAVTPTDDTEIGDYQIQADINWDNATNADEKLALIATQKWLHYSVVQPMEGWSEQRRLRLPEFSFEIDNSNALTAPPARWLYSSGEMVYNTANYNTVKAKDNLTTKIFWDVK